MATQLVGVIGDPVHHSLSPAIHNAAFAAAGLDFVSVAFRVPPAELGAAVAAMGPLGIVGLSVTMPHKETVVAHCAGLTERAAALGVVNCLYVEPDGAVMGDSTDGAGIIAALARGAGVDVTGKHCAVLGAGGAARAAVLALGQAGAASVLVVNRSPERATSAAALISQGHVGEPRSAADCEIVIQATPCGMADTTSAHLEPPLPGDQLGRGQVALDLIYHPRPTAWLAAAANAGAKVIDGLGPLVHQGAVQLERWTGSMPDLDAMWRAATGA